MVHQAYVQLEVFSKDVLFLLFFFSLYINDVVSDSEQDFVFAFQALLPFLPQWAMTKPIPKVPFLDTAPHTLILFLFESLIFTY